MIAFDERRGMDLIGVFPGVVAFRVTFPFDQVLQGFAASLSPLCVDLFYFIFFFSINQIRGRSREVGSVCWHFSVRCQETGMKHRVNTPLGWEFELHGNWRDDFDDLERSMASWGQLSSSIQQWEVLPFKPDWLPSCPY